MNWDTPEDSWLEDYGAEHEDDRPRLYHQGNNYNLFNVPLPLYLVAALQRFFYGEPQLGPMQAIMPSDNPQPRVDFPPTPPPTQEFPNDGSRCRNRDSGSSSQGSGINAGDEVDTPSQVRYLYEAERARNSSGFNISNNYILYGCAAILFFAGVFCFLVCTFGVYLFVYYSAD